MRVSWEMIGIIVTLATIVVTGVSRFTALETRSDGIFERVHRYEDKFDSFMDKMSEQQEKNEKNHKVIEIKLNENHVILRELSSKVRSISIYNHKYYKHTNVAKLNKDNGGGT